MDINTLNQYGMKPCPLCKSAEVGSELRCMGSFVVTKCYNCGHEGESSMSRSAAKYKWNNQPPLFNNL